MIRKEKKQIQLPVKLHNINFQIKLILNYQERILKTKYFLIKLNDYIKSMLNYFKILIFEELCFFTYVFQGTILKN